MNKSRLMWLGVVVILIASFWFWRQGNPEMSVLNGGKVSLPSGIESTFEAAGFQLSEDADRINLLAVDGGNGSGVASLEEINGKFVHYIIADLEEVEDAFYEGWLVNEAGDILYTGKLSQDKGGWILAFETEADLVSYKKVVVTLEMVDDQKPEGHVLEGEFE